MVVRGAGLKINCPKNENRSSLEGDDLFV